MEIIFKNEESGIESTGDGEIIGKDGEVVATFEYTECVGWGAETTVVLTYKDGRIEEISKEGVGPWQILSKLFIKEGVS